MIKRSLWKEFISESLEETKEKLSEKAIDNIIDCIETTIENSWMITGVVEGRDPKDVEIERLKLLHEEEKKSLNKQILIYRESVASRRRVPIEDVCIEEGSVIYGHSL